MRATIPRGRYWLKQARADLGAASAASGGVRECHRRYWLQQAYEKAVKAACVASIPSGRPREVLLILRDTILRTHGPLSAYPRSESLADFRSKLRRDYPAHHDAGLKLFKLVRRQAHALVANRKGASALRKIDGTVPSLSAGEVSYRYPFFVEGEEQAPADWDGWDQYQGPEQEVKEAVRKLIDAAGVAVSLHGRSL